MKKYLLYILTLLFSLTLVSCELDDSDKKEDDITLEKTAVVTGFSDDVIEGGPNDRYQLDTDGLRIVITDRTRIYVQRESCSGLNEGSPIEIREDYTVIIRYDVDDIEYMGNPNVVRPYVIEAYRPGCLGGTP